MVRSVSRRSLIWATAGVAALVFATGARAEEVELVGGGDTFVPGGGGPTVAGPREDPFGGWDDGQAISATVIPERSGAPSRVELPLTRRAGPDAPLRLALHTVAADGRPGAILAATTVSSNIFQLGHTPPPFQSVPVAGWPRLEAGTRYGITAFVRQAEAHLDWWYVTSGSSSVVGGFYGRVTRDATEPSWEGPLSGHLGIRVFGTPPRPTRLTANGLVANVSTRQVFLRPSATLVALDPREPLSGKAITFSAGGNQICAATTNANGVASCGGTAPFISAARALGNYRAAFAGDAGFEPSGGNGALVR